MTDSIHRFAAFELDPERRALRLEGRELALQPRVFDLLRFLFENRDRVVSKDELLDTLWPKVVVTEGSLQRAISLARTALEEGGLGNAIRTYSRRGYRFLIDESGDASALDQAQGSFAAARWKDAMHQFAATDQVQPLVAEALERWGTAAQCAGDLQAAILPLERAAVSWSSRGEREAAARATIALARVHIESVNAAVAQGCLRRAARLLEGLPENEQHGFLAATLARLHLYGGDLASAAEESSKAREIGKRLHNTDVEALGLLYAGIAQQATGQTSQGLATQGEAAAAVLAGDVSPLLGGIVYCGLISSCCNCGDWQRADQWTESFVGWCRRGNIDTFSGSCLIHQAEVFAMSGKLDEAHEAMERAAPAIQSGAPWAYGDVHRLMGDLQFARGDRKLAEKSYHEAYQRGWDPYPGYAMLLHELGRSDEAIDGLKRAATLTNWSASERKARYLACAANIAALVGRVDDARSLLAILDAQPRYWECGAVAGQVAHARAELLWASAQHEAALEAFRRAIDVMKQFRAVMDCALARARLAQCYQTRGEHGAAEMERLAAEAVFSAAGATGYLRSLRGD